MDKSIYEDLTAKDVLSINDSLSSFRFFYDNIRATIVANSSEYEKEEYKRITYNDMYKMIHYWSSADYLNLIESSKQTYNEEMSQYQSQIDSVADHYRALIDSSKIIGNTAYPSYEAFVKEIVPEVVFNYISAQESTSLPYYLDAKKYMIVEYVDPGYNGAEAYLYRLIESNLEDMFMGETAVYNIATCNNKKATDEFESSVGKYTYSADEWISPSLQLPINHPNGNYILTDFRYEPFTTGEHHDILTFGDTYYATQTVSEDRYGNSTELTFEIIAYRDKTISGQVIERSRLGHRPDEVNEYNYPIEGKWGETSRHDKRVMRVRFELAKSHQYYTIFIDEDQNVYINDLNAKPEKLHKK